MLPHHFPDLDSALLALEDAGYGPTEDCPYLHRRADGNLIEIVPCLGGEVELVPRRAGANRRTQHRST